MNTLASWLLELTNAVPWPWRAFLVAGMPLAIALMVARLGVIGLLFAESAYTSQRRRRGRAPGALTHAVSDGLDICCRWLRRLAVLTFVAAGIGVLLVAAAAPAGSGWAIDIQQDMADYADRVTRGS